jgi:phosphate transporter
MQFACNFGGMTTPISSMQNVIAWSALKVNVSKRPLRLQVSLSCSPFPVQNAGYPVDFGAWLGFAIPFCTLCVLVTWGILIWIMRPTDVQSIPLIIYSCERRLLSARNAIVVALTLMAILLWSTVSITSGMLGDAGIISLLLMVVLFGTGILNEVDFNSFSWHTLWLLGGGNVLGLAVTNSGLLDVIVGGILTDTSHENKWMVALQMVLLTTLTSTFVSHTVCALIIMPIIVQLGQACEMATEFGLMGALACSAGCALPMASFPNVTCLMITDDFNRGYLSAKHFLMNGIPVSLMTIGLIMTFGAFLIVIIAV